MKIIASEEYVEDGEEVLHERDTVPSSDLLKDTEYLNSMNTVLAQKSLDEVLEWCYRSLPHLYQVSSFGSTGMVIMHALHKLGLKVPVIFLDTLYHFQETLEHAKQVEDQYGLEVYWYRCKLAQTREDFERIFKSKNMWIEDPHKYEQLTKVEPLERALCEKNVFAWITGRRRDQGGMRTDIKILEIDAVDGRLKVNPLAFWTREEIWNYLKRENVPYNPLFDKSYTSIGDSVTTTISDPNMEERGNRFYQFQGKTECGIHNRRTNKAS